MADLTADKIFTEALPNKLAKDPETFRAIDAVYQINIDGDQAWTIDFTKDSDFVSSGAAENADCTVTMKEADFIEMWNGNLPGPQALMMGKLKIDGNMALAMKLQKFL